MNIDVFLNALIAYFVIIDPMGTALIFNALVKGHDPKHCRRVAFSATAISMLVITGCGFFGAKLFSQLGITLDAFRIAGGLLLFQTAFQMTIHPETEPDTNDLPPPDIAAFPLTFPLLAGPGCLTLTILLFSREHTVAGISSVLLAVATILLVTLITLLLSHKFVSVIGKTANNVMQRLLGVILASLSIQFIADGVLGLIAGTN